MFRSFKVDAETYFKDILYTTNEFSFKLLFKIHRKISYRGIADPEKIKP